MNRSAGAGRHPNEPVTKPTNQFMEEYPPLIHDPTIITAITEETGWSDQDKKEVPGTRKGQIYFSTASSTDLYYYYYQVETDGIVSRQKVFFSEPAYNIDLEIDKKILQLRIQFYNDFWQQLDLLEGQLMRKMGQIGIVLIAAFIFMRYSIEFIVRIYQIFKP